MAVQAQYPSNLFLLNNNSRNGQEMKDSEFFSQPQMYFNNDNNGGGSNPRKRERDGVGGTRGNGSFSLQSQPNHTTVINLSQLQNQQSNLVSTGLHLANHHQQRQSSLLSEDLTAQLKQQRDEIDQFLQLQGDQLRRTLAERRQAHCHSILGAIEESAATKRLRETEAEIQRGTRRNNELEQRAAQLKVESQIWQNRARRQEATAASLQVQLQQAMTSHGAQSNREEKVGCCSDGESAHVDPEREVSWGGPSCKACRESVASVVLLPCRHLCLCRKCNAEVDACPVCLAYRSASVEVHLS